MSVEAIINQPVSRKSLTSMHQDLSNWSLALQKHEVQLSQLDQASASDTSSIHQCIISQTEKYRPYSMSFQQWQKMSNAETIQDSESNLNAEQPSIHHGIKYLTHKLDSASQLKLQGDAESNTSMHLNLTSNFPIDVDSIPVFSPISQISVQESFDDPFSAKLDVILECEEHSLFQYPDAKFSNKISCDPFECEKTSEENLQKDILGTTVDNISIYSVNSSDVEFKDIEIESTLKNSFESPKISDSTSYVVSEKPALLSSSSSSLQSSVSDDLTNFSKVHHSVTQETECISSESNIRFKNESDTQETAVIENISLIALSETHGSNSMLSEIEKLLPAKVDTDNDLKSASQESVCEIDMQNSMHSEKYGSTSECDITNTTCVSNSSTNKSVDNSSCHDVKEVENILLEPRTHTNTKFALVEEQPTLNDSAIKEDLATKTIFVEEMNKAFDSASKSSGNKNFNRLSESYAKNNKGNSDKHHHPNLLVCAPSTVNKYSDIPNIVAVEEILLNSFNSNTLKDHYRTVIVEDAALQHTSPKTIIVVEKVEDVAANHIEEVESLIIQELHKSKHDCSSIDLKNDVENSFSHLPTKPLSQFNQLVVVESISCHQQDGGDLNNRSQTILVEEQHEMVEPDNELASPKTIFVQEMKNSYGNDSTEHDNVKSCNQEKIQSAEQTHIKQTAIAVETIAVETLSLKPLVLPVIDSTQSEVMVTSTSEICEADVTEQKFLNEVDPARSFTEKDFDSNSSISSRETEEKDKTTDASFSVKVNHKLNKTESLMIDPIPIVSDSIINKVDTPSAIDCDAEGFYSTCFDKAKKVVNEQAEIKNNSNQNEHESNSTESMAEVVHSPSYIQQQNFRMVNIREKPIESSHVSEFASSNFHSTKKVLENETYHNKKFSEQTNTSRFGDKSRAGFEQKKKFFESSFESSFKSVNTKVHQTGQVRSVSAKFLADPGQSNMNLSDNNFTSGVIKTDSTKSKYQSANPSKSTTKSYFTAQPFNLCHNKARSVKPPAGKTLSLGSVKAKARSFQTNIDLAPKVTSPKAKNMPISKSFEEDSTLSDNLSTSYQVSSNKLLLQESYPISIIPEKELSQPSNSLQEVEDSLIPPPIPSLPNFDITDFSFSDEGTK